MKIDDNWIVSDDNDASGGCKITIQKEGGLIR